MHSHLEMPSDPGPYFAQVAYMSLEVAYVDQHSDCWIQNDSRVGQLLTHLLLLANHCQRSRKEMHAYMQKILIAWHAHNTDTATIKECWTFIKYLVLECSHLSSLAYPLLMHDVA